MKFACTLRDAGAADDVALEPAGLDQRAGARALVRVLEDRPERARLARLALAARAAASRARVARISSRTPRSSCSTALRRRPRRAAHVRVAVAQLELARARRCATPAGGDDLGRAQHVADLAAVGARVHAHRAAHGARDGAAELDARERRPRWQRRTTAASEAPPPQRTLVPVDLDRRQRALEAQRDAVVALVGDEQVGAEADHGDVEPFGLGPGEHLARARPPTSAAPGSAPAPPVPIVVSRASGGVGLDSGRRRAHASRSRTSSSTASTGPAPSVSTRSPGRARAHDPLGRVGVGRASRRSGRPASWRRALCDHELAA